ncbi:hypothetical protein ACOXXX_11120 [Thalassococcus sp. BH17M4-6]|uniref:hypothetical protein n=1 Tax=Thalassococcus sp. BH17M4-6 TaxID=3413148 RepID=UPI003BEA47D5
MAMIRPAAREALWRWREVLIGAGVLLLGLYWGFFTGGGFLHYVGYAVVLIGLALGIAGVQRARFRQGGGGPGVVQINEGRVGYFGPLTGGVVDLADLTALTLDPTARPPHWILSQTGQPDLQVPLTAKGADSLFDAFATLPGIRTEHMLRQMQGGARYPVVIWRSPDAPDLPERLH